MPAIAQENKIIRKIVAVGVLALVVLAFGLYLYQATRIEAILNETHMLYEQRRQLISETETLQAQVSRLVNVDRISRQAREKFGMVFNETPPLHAPLRHEKPLDEILSQWRAEIKKNNTNPEPIRE
ncbi:MAG: hypothetical protein D6677_07900 [Calditrichaeota bacterium]|nr:MAG: hypothetical protein D6677_07900 [Calditrichota bacterium]